MLRQRLGQLVEQVRLALLADEVRKAFPAVVVNRAGLVVIVIQHQQAKRLGAVFAGLQGVAEQVGRESFASCEESSTTDFTDATDKRNPCSSVLSVVNSVPRLRLRRSKFFAPAPKAFGVPVKLPPRTPLPVPEALPTSSAIPRAGLHALTPPAPTTRALLIATHRRIYPP